MKTKVAKSPWRLSTGMRPIHAKTAIARGSKSNAFLARTPTADFSILMLLRFTQIAATDQSVFAARMALITSRRPSCAGTRLTTQSAS